MTSTNLIDYSYYKSTKDKGNYNLYRLVKKINFLLEKKEGFVVLKNFQINKNNLKITKIRYENFLKNFGKLEIQNKKKEKIAEVINKGKKWSAHNRGYITNAYIPFHTDGGTIAALLCINNSSKGGHSIITQSRKIYITLKKKYPKLLQILKEGFHYHTRGEKTNNENRQISKKKYPVFFHKNRRLHCMFNKKPIVWALKNIKGKINSKTKKALDIFEKLSNRRKNMYRFKLNPGDMLIYNNFKVLHGREKFNDLKKKKRLILRAWIKSKNTKYSGLNLLDAYMDR